MTRSGDGFEPDIEIKNNIDFPRGPGRPPGAQNKPKIPPVDATSGVAAQELQQFVSRIENLEAEKKAISDDIKDIFAELTGRGFQAKPLRAVLRIRKQDHSERMELEAITELYLSALGMT